MRAFLKKIIEINTHTPPDEVLDSFNKNFSDTMNIEWFSRKDCYEAIFYKDNSEHIALFDPEANLLEYRVNITASHLPVAISEIAGSRGEIMNSVLKNKGNKIEYELIVRDKDLKRHMVVFSDNGKLIEDRHL